LSLGRAGHPGAARAVPYALANAALIAAYTLVDAAGARTSGAATSYVLWMYALEGLPFALFVGWRRGARPLIDAMRARWRTAVGGGLFSALSYGIAVWAMTVAPVGAVSALRETSVVFAMCLGPWLLKERLDARRWVGVAAVLAGALTLRI
jgi:drug/metabolite transporter (DMT)-like permease